MLDTVYRTVVMYILLLCTMRLAGKRQLGQLEPTEFVVTMLVANLASIPIENPDIPILHGMMAILVILGLEMVFQWVTLHNIRLRRVLCGKPVILIDNGKVLYTNLKRTRITMDELSGQLRLQGVLDISTVRYAILETNGGISVFPNPTEDLPVTIISDGRLLENNLHLCGKDEVWVRRTLKKYAATQENTLLMTVDGKNKVVLIPKSSDK